MLTRILLAEILAFSARECAPLMDAEREFEVVPKAADGRTPVETGRAPAPQRFVVMENRQPGLNGIEATRQISASSAVRAP